MYILKWVMVVAISFTSVFSFAHQVRLKGVEIEDVVYRYAAGKYRVEIIFKAMPSPSDVVIANDNGSEGGVDTWSCGYGISMRKVGRYSDSADGFAAALTSLALSAQAQGLAVDILVEDSLNCSDKSGGHLRGLSLSGQ